MAHAPHLEDRFGEPTLLIVLGGVAAMFVLSLGVGARIADRAGDAGEAFALADGDDGSCEGEAAGTPSTALRPFDEGSPWNQPLPDDAEFSGAGDPRTAQLRAREVRSADGDTSWPVRLWVNVEEYSIPVVVADRCDPVAVVLDEDEGEQLRTRIPHHAEPAAGRDAHLVVIEPGGERAVELWHAQRVDDDRWTAGRIERVHLRGDGLGPDGGVRAYGGSALGGLIRTWEVDPAHPEHRDGTIEHPLALALPDAMLRYDRGHGGYDDDGYGTALGYRWPATEQDFDSPYAYRGTIRMGTLVAIPPDVDLDELGLGRAARGVADALQRYGAYVVDRTAGDTIALYAEPDVPASWRDALRGPSHSAAQLERIRQELVVVDQQLPGGGGR